MLFLFKVSYLISNPMIIPTISPTLFQKGIKHIVIQTHDVANMSGSWACWVSVGDQRKDNRGVERGGGEMMRRQGWRRQGWRRKGWRRKWWFYRLLL